MTFHPFSSNFIEILDGHFSWQARYLMSLDLDTCCSAHTNNVSFVTRAHHEIHFSGQYLVSLDNDACYAAHCKWRFMCEED